VTLPRFAVSTTARNFVATVSGTAMPSEKSTTDLRPGSAPIAVARAVSAAVSTLPLRSRIISS
jgi:hypothetical protein